MQPNKIQVISRTAPREPYTEVCTFEKSKSATLFAKRNYSVDIGIGLNTSYMGPITCVFHTGAGPTLLREDHVKHDWLTLIRPCDNQRLKNATNQEVKVVGTNMLHDRTEYIHVRVMFGIVRNLAIRVLLGATLVDRYIKGVFPTDWKIVSFNPSGTSLSSARSDQRGNNRTTYGSPLQHLRAKRPKTQLSALGTHGNFSAVCGDTRYSHE